ncbi:hypothetical protein Dvina_44095 [Dactylosporangium vinaceum]|uniref:Uncharacterized protein n=2 Tax=Dactylosporangium vinaceum TaxID=53362 RepID=A0ABV5MGU3_9ACTN|nr:hypothetical protein Dvina_44095 [Dactylosporangium vinaceum]
MIVGSLLLIVVAVGLLVLGLLQGSDALLVASIGASLLAAVALIVGGRQAAAARSARTTRTGRQMPSERYDPFASHLGADELGGEDLEESGEYRRSERQAVGAGARTGTTYGTSTGGGGRAVPPDETAMMAPVRDEPDSAIPQQGDRYDEYPPQADQDPYEQGGYDQGYGQQGYDNRGYDQHAAAGHHAELDDDDDDDDEYDDEDPADEPAIQQSSAADLARVAALNDDVLVIDGRPRYHVSSCPHLLGRESEPLPAHEAVELGFTPCAICAPNDVLLAGRR